MLPKSNILNLDTSLQKVNGAMKGDFLHINQDLEVLYKHVDHHHKECEVADAHVTSWLVMLENASPISTPHPHLTPIEEEELPPYVVSG